MTVTQIGALLHGQCQRIRQQLGKGGFGAVYLADDTRLPGRQEAFKENLNHTRPMINLFFLLLLALALPGASFTCLVQSNFNPPTVTVLVETNLRVAPALNGEIVGRAPVDAVYIVLDATSACTWLQVAALDDPQSVSIGWITGHPAYVATNASCVELMATLRPVVVPTATPDDKTLAPAMAVIVQIDGVAIRTGPGANQPALRTAAAGEQLQVDGQIDNCRWLHLYNQDGQGGWISGNFAYSQLIGECADPPDLASPTPAPLPHASVLLDNVNIRAEASTRARVLRKAARNETFVVTGQTDQCIWLQIELGDDGAIGWISGNPAYTTLDQPCSALASVAPTATPRPTTVATPRRQGCATIPNHLGFTVRIDVVRNSNWQDNFTLAPEASRYYCVDPGVYTATLSATTRRDRFSVPLFVNGGENYLTPLRMP